jgi:hypothetical protein
MALPLIAAGVAARVVAKKVAKEVAKKSAKKANARALKAANKPVTKNKEKVYSTDIKAKKMGVLKPGQTTEYTRNQLKNVIKPARPNRTRGGGMDTLKKQEAAAKANKMVSNLKDTKPLKNVPKGVSSRFDDTIKKLAAEKAKKKK